MKNRVYTVSYLMYRSDKEKNVTVLAPDKETAYDVATYEIIPEKENGATPYASWVRGYTAQNGNYHRFNTFPGNPY